MDKSRGEGGVPKLPYFPLNPWEYLLDDKIDSLSLEEEGANLRLWSYEWINKVKRGHLLKDKKTPIPDDKIAKKVRLSAEKFEKFKKKILEINLHKIGKNGELYSLRLSKYKTKYELYDKGSETYRKPIGNRSETYRAIPTLPTLPTLPNHTLPILKDGDKSPELSTSQQKEKISIFESPNFRQGQSTIGEELKKVIDSIQQGAEDDSTEVKCVSAIFGSIIEKYHQKVNFGYIRKEIIRKRESHETMRDATLRALGIIKEMPSLEEIREKEETLEGWIRDRFLYPTKYAK